MTQTQNHPCYPRLRFGVRRLPRRFSFIGKLLFLWKLGLLALGDSLSEAARGVALFVPSVPLWQTRNLSHIALLRSVVPHCALLRKKLLWTKPETTNQYSNLRCNPVTSRYVSNEKRN
jgi:hypothetical protein